MADENDLTLKIGADASDVAPGAAQATAAVEDFGSNVAELSNAIRAQTEAMSSGFAQLGKTITESMTEARAATAEEEVELGGLLSTVREGVGSFNELKESVLGIGEAMLAAFAVRELAEWSQKMGEGGEKTEHMAQTLGTSVGNVQALGGAFALMGVNQDKGFLATERLDRAFAMARQGAKQQIEAFNELGVSTTKNYTQMDLLGAVMDGFKSKADGPAKVAEAMELFGRAGAAMVPFLDQGKAGLDELIRVENQYGVVNEGAVKAAAQLGSAWNENHVAVTGLNNVMAQAFAPTMTIAVQGMNRLIASYIASYKAGGDAKVATDLLVDGFKILVSVAVSLGEGCIAAFHYIKGGLEDLGVAWETVKITITSALSAVETELRTFAQVAHDAFSLDWGRIEGDWQAGMNRAAKIVADGSAKIADLHAKNAAGVNGEFAAGNRALTDNGFLNHLWNGKPSKQRETTGEGADGDTSGLGGPPKKAKKAPDDAVATWTEQLHESEMKAAQDTGLYQTDQTANELKFWQAKLALTKAGSKDWLDVQSKIYDLEKQLNESTVSDQLKEFDRQIQAQAGNAAAQEKIEAQKVAYISQQYGAQSEKLKEALDEQRQMIRQHAEEAAAEAAKGIETQEKATVDGYETELNATKTSAEEQVDAIKTAAKDRVTGQRQAAAEIAQIHKQEAADEIAITQAMYAREIEAQEQIRDLPNQTVEAQRAASGKIVEIKAAETKAIAALTAAGELQQVKDVDAGAQQQIAAYTKVGDRIRSTFDSALDGMILHHETFAQEILKVESSLVSGLISGFTKMAEHFVISQLTQTASAQAGVAARTAANAAGTTQQVAASGAASLKTVANNAASAASGAYQAFAAVPLIGPVLGAAAAAATFAAVMGFDAMIASAEGGWGQVPADGMMTELHKNEMVLPAQYATPLRAALTGGGIGARAGSASGYGAAASGGVGQSGAPTRGGGDTHNWNVQALDARSVRGWARSNAGKTAVRGLGRGTR